MPLKNQTGYSLLFIVLTLVWMASCGKKSDDDDETPTDRYTDTTVPKLSNSFVDTSKTLWIHGVFGKSSSAGDAYEFYTTDRTIDVYASAAGVVETIIYNREQTGNKEFYQDDYEIHIRANNSKSVYSLIIDHVRNVTVKVGSEVKAGDVLGIVGRTSSENGTEGRIELSVYKWVSEGHSIALCPDTFAEAAFKAAMEVARTKHNTNQPTKQLSTLCEVDKLD